MNNSHGSLAKKSGLYFIGNFASKIIMAAMVPFYAYYVSVQELGVFNYSQIIMNILSPITYLAIWEAILRLLVAEKDKEQRANVIATSLRFVQVVLFFLFLFSVIFAFNQNKVFMYTMLMICIYGAAQIWQYYARSLGFNHIYVVGSVTGTIVNFLMLVITMSFLNLGATSLFWSFILGQISIILVIEMKVHVFKYSKTGDFDWFILKRMLIFSVPLVLNLTSNWLIAGFGKIIIMYQLGAYANGLYSFAMNFGTIVTMVGSVISMALIEEAIIKSGEKEVDEYFSNVIENVFKLFLSLCVVAIPCISIFYNIISKTGYSKSYQLVPLFILYAIITTMATNVGAIFQAKNKTNQLFYTTIFGAVTTIVLSFLLVNFIGIQGVAIAQIFGALVMLTLRWIYAKKLIKFSVRWNKICILTLTYLFVGIVWLKGTNLMSFTVSIFAIMVVCYINKNILLRIKKIGISKINSKVS
ncbi:lipopolysaccharide biosynthesis protein [Fictibacillus fluitans]|uniref:Polysaccharide biosynthesis C-terminal domain-containing protein n=1 Tax=Fictibacillus fluitans TaxID=3058422 RepID=A0ABT8HT76_9BACL|nr:polysaccharide biosynthesis C-terminal domain-containing protein [Fictibacillus sp. NE201]MDN4523951.1 polysaccharide biosynthesis C-terminal domain-containing protein [Fictibacillus sp. NE201]